MGDEEAGGTAGRLSETALVGDPTADTSTEGLAARVLRTGIALVHEGELVLPAAGDAAQAERVARDARSSVHYIFPVEIEVRAAPDAIDPDTLVERTLAKLAQGLHGLPGFEGA